MNVFVVNSGSSSFKYQLFRMPDENPLCTGLVERIGQEIALIIHKVINGKEERVVKKEMIIKDHQEGFIEVVNLLVDKEIGVVKSLDDIKLVGHRVVHGGESFSETAFITESVKAEIKGLFPLAPLHNPPNYSGIEVAEKIFSQARQIAVFDTAFHQSMPEKVFRYAIPERFYKEDRVRAYGFHGTSHKYVSERAMEYLGKPDAKVISIHLGNGCSITAVSAGKSLDTSMGFGPLSGLVMGTRSGDIDPSIIFYLIEKKGYTHGEVKDLLNKNSGMLGLTGYNDMRDITRSIEEGSKVAALAYEMYAYRIKKYIGAYAAALNGLDAVVFTAGVGENDSRIRALVCEGMGFLGIALDEEKNNSKSREIREINASGSKVKVLVIPTNEELEIARQCYRLANLVDKDKTRGERK